MDAPSTATMVKGTSSAPWLAIVTTCEPARDEKNTTSLIRRERGNMTRRVPMKSKQLQHDEQTSKTSTLSKQHTHSNTNQES